MKKKKVIGIIAGVGMVSILVVGSMFLKEDNLNENPFKGISLTDDRNEEKAVERKVFEAEIKNGSRFDSMTYKEGKLLLKYHVLDLKGEVSDSNIKDLEEGIVTVNGVNLSGEVLKVENKTYVIIYTGYLNKFNFDSNGKLYIRTIDGKEQKFDILELNLELLEDGSFKFFSSEKANFVYENIGFDDAYTDYFESEKKRDLILNGKETIRRLTEIYKNEEDGSLNYKNILGTNEYVEMEDMLGEIVELKTGKIFKRNLQEKREEMFFDEIFFHENNMFARSYEGNLLELELKNGKIEVVKKYDSNIEIGDEKIVGRYSILNKDNNFVYIVFKGNKHVNQEIRESRSLIYSFDLKSKKANVIGGSDIKEKYIVNPYYGVDNYVLFNKNLEKSDKLSIGKLEGNKIKTLIEGIDAKNEFPKLWTGEEFFIVEDVTWSEQMQRIGTKIMVYKR